MPFAATPFDANVVWTQTRGAMRATNTSLASSIIFGSAGPKPGSARRSASTGRAVAASVRAPADRRQCVFARDRHARPFTHRAELSQEAANVLYAVTGDGAAKGKARRVPWRREPSMTGSRFVVVSDRHVLYGRGRRARRIGRAARRRARGGRAREPPCGRRRPTSAVTSRSMRRPATYRISAAAKGFAPVTISVKSRTRRFRRNRTRTARFAEAPADRRGDGRRPADADSRYAAVDHLLRAADFDALGDDRIVDGLHELPGATFSRPDGGAASAISVVSLRGPDPSESLLAHSTAQLLNDGNTGDVDLSRPSRRRVFRRGRHRRARDRKIPTAATRSAARST